MTKKQAISTVKKFQQWRRGTIDDLSSSPYEIGKALDKVIQLAEMNVRKQRKSKLDE